MKVLILNSGLGKRMGRYTENSPKCMVRLDGEETILARQLRLLEAAGIREVVMTTGPYKELLEDYVEALKLSLQIQYIHNPLYKETNYIYSIYLAREYLHSDLLLLHGDLVFEEKVLRQMLETKESCMAVSSAVPLPEKDFKAVVVGKKIKAVGIEFTENVVAAQPMYRFQGETWERWLAQIIRFCENGEVSCYAEKALNVIADEIELYPYDFKMMLCQEVDQEEDLVVVKGILADKESR